MYQHFYTSCQNGLPLFQYFRIIAIERMHNLQKHLYNHKVCWCQISFELNTLYFIQTCTRYQTAALCAFITIYICCRQLLELHTSSSHHIFLRHHKVVVYIIYVIISIIVPQLLFQACRCPFELVILISAQIGHWTNKIYYSITNNYYTEVNRPSRPTKKTPPVTKAVNQFTIPIEITNN